MFKIQEKGAFTQLRSQDIPMINSKSDLKKNQSQLKMKNNQKASMKDPQKFSNVKTQRQLEKLRRQLNIQHYNTHTNPKFIKSQERLENRENFLFRRADISKRKTYKDVQESKKLKGNKVNIFI